MYLLLLFLLPLNFMKYDQATARKDEEKGKKLYLTNESTKEQRRDHACCKIQETRNK